LRLITELQGFIYMGKVCNKMALEIEKKTIELLELRNPLIHTIISDTEKKFGNHANITEQLNLSFLLNLTIPGKEDRMKI
jgi:hypothetical protein